MSTGRLNLGVRKVAWSPSLGWAEPLGGGVPLVRKGQDRVWKIEGSVLDVMFELSRGS